MKNKLLYVLSVICRDEQSGKKTIQKLIYLAEEKGLDLELDYSIHFYGPYSSDLDHYLHSFEATDDLSIDTTGVTHKIKIKNNKNKQKNNPLTEAENEILDYIMQNFSSKTPLDLEVITTTDYVIKKIVADKELSRKNVIETVKKIKGDKFTVPQIENSVDILVNSGFIGNIS